MNYIYKEGEILERNNSGNLKIIKRYFRNSRRGYIYKCLNCGNEDKISEYGLKNGHGCNVCCKPSRKILIGYNDLWTTNPEIAKLLKDKKIGFKISKGNHNTEEFVCPDCGQDFKKVLNNVVNQGFSCPYCSDGIPYPEKFMICLLKQLNIKFKFQKIFDWSKNVKYYKKDLSGTKRYDFYIPSVNIIIETNGRQHYEKSGFPTTYIPEMYNEKGLKTLMYSRLYRFCILVLHCNL